MKIVTAIALFGIGDYTNEELYRLSQRIINPENNREACNISYTDVYDFAAKKQSLKKWENELDIRLQELRLPSL